VDAELKALRRIAKQGKRLRVKLDSTSGDHRWRLTGFTQQVLARQPGTNAPTRALCTMTFTAASDAVVEVGPVSGGHNGSGNGGKDDDKDRPKFYVVKKGDTLQSIAEKFYGKASYWRGIADVNNIRDPRKLKVGTKLTLPRKNAADFGPAPGAEFGDEE
jgi:nucleoid-associated protein YgaU